MPHQKFDPSKNYLLSRKTRDYGTNPSGPSKALIKMNSCCHSTCHQKIDIESPDTHLLMLRPQLTGEGSEIRHFGYICSENCLNEYLKNDDKNMPFLYSSAKQLSPEAKSRLKDENFRNYLKLLNNLDPSHLHSIIEGMRWQRTVSFRKLESRTRSQQSKLFAAHYTKRKSGKLTLPARNTFSYINIHETDLSYLQLKSSVIVYQCRFFDCSFFNKDIFNPKEIMHTTFVRCNIQFNIINTTLREVMFKDSIFTRVKFINCEIDSTVVFENCAFIEVDFTNAEIHNCMFKGRVEFFNCAIPDNLISTLKRQNVAYTIDSKYADTVSASPHANTTHDSAYASPEQRSPSHIGLSSFFDKHEAQRPKASAETPENKLTAG